MVIKGKLWQTYSHYPIAVVDIIRATQHTHTYARTFKCNVANCPNYGGRPTHNINRIKKNKTLKQQQWSSTIANNKINIHDRSGHKQISREAKETKNKNMNGIAHIHKIYYYIVCTIFIYRLCLVYIQYTHRSHTTHTHTRLDSKIKERSARYCKLVDSKKIKVMP